MVPGWRSANRLHDMALSRATMRRYQHLTEDQLLQLADEKEQFTLEARMALESDVSRKHERRLTVLHTMDEALAELDIQSPHFEPLE